MSPLALNIFDLMCADRGITGGILKPFFRGILFLKLAPPTAQRFISHVDNLFEDSTRASLSAGSEEVTSEQPGESTADISVSRLTAWWLMTVVRRLFWCRSAFCVGLIFTLWALGYSALARALRETSGWNRGVYPIEVEP